MATTIKNSTKQNALAQVRKDKKAYGVCSAVRDLVNKYKKWDSDDVVAVTDQAGINHTLARRIFNEERG